MGRKIREINREKKKERIRKYNRKRYRNNREEDISSLGGECVICGTKEYLEIDHIVPATKHPLLRKGQVLSLWLKERREKELAKCQLLCKPCHIKKGRVEKTGNEEISHGTHSTYKNHCSGTGCGPCKEANAKYQRGRYWGKKGYYGI